MTPSETPPPSGAPRPDFFAENAKNPGVVVPRADLEHVRDLLLERVHGNPARSAGHNARLEIEAMLAAAPRQQGAEVVGWFRQSKANPSRNEWYQVDEAEVPDLKRMGYRVQPLYATPQPVQSAPGREEIARIIRDRVKVDATGLAPAVTSVFVIGVEDAADAILAALSQRAPEGEVTIPREPSDGLLMSMAIRWDHGLGCPGYYDQPIFSGQASHEQRLRSTLSTMRQLHEEVVGGGFYEPSREADYVARKAALQLPAPVAEEE